MDPLSARSIVKSSSIQPYVYVLGVHSIKLEFTLTAEIPLHATLCLSRSPLHFIHIMIISRLGESCTCGYLFPPREIPWTIEGTAHHYNRLDLLLLCCTWDTQDDKELTLVSSRFEGYYIVLHR
jgi:hypothetical protein